jgi:hypothetical protein
LPSDLENAFCGAKIEHTLAADHGTAHFAVRIRCRRPKLDLDEFRQLKSLLLQPDQGFLFRALSLAGRTIEHPTEDQDILREACVLVESPHLQEAVEVGA